MSQVILHLVVEFLLEQVHRCFSQVLQREVGKVVSIQVIKHAIHGLCKHGKVIPSLRESFKNLSFLALLMQAGQRMLRYVLFDDLLEELVEFLSIVSLVTLKNYYFINCHKLFVVHNLLEPASKVAK